MTLWFRLEPPSSRSRQHWCSMMQGVGAHASACLIHSDFGVLLTLFLYSREKFPPFGDKEAGLCAGWCRVARNPVIVIGVFLLENFQEALTGEHVDSASGRVVEQVVRTTCNFTGRDFLPSFRVEDKQSRRPPASHEEPVMSFVERHREIVFGGSNGPTGQDGALDSINDFDLLLVWNVHEKTSPRFLKAKRFRMRVDDDVPNLLPVGIQKPKPSRALLSFPELLCPGVSHDHSLAPGIEANVVGVIGELQSRKHLKCGPIEDLRDAIKAAGDE